MTYFMLGAKLHFAKIDEVVFGEKTCIFVADEILGQLPKKIDTWSYWGRTKAYREDNISILPLSKYTGKYGSNTKFLAQTKHDISKDDICVIVGLVHQNLEQIIQDRAKILIFPKSNEKYKVKLGINFELYFKLLNYEGQETQKIVDLLNIGSLESDNLAQKILQNTPSGKIIIQKNRQILGNVLTECFIDYEGSTAISFENLKLANILPQEMVYFGKAGQILETQNKTKIATYTIIGNSNQWTANGGIAHFLGQYLGQKLDICTEFFE